MNDDYLNTYKEKVVRIELNSNKNRTTEYPIGKDYSWMIVPPLNCKEDVKSGFITEKKGVTNIDFPIYIILTDRLGNNISIGYNNKTIPLKIDIRNYVSFFICYRKVEVDSEFLLFLEDSNLQDYSHMRIEVARNNVRFCEIMNAYRVAIAYDVYETYRHNINILVAEMFSGQAKDLAIKLDIMLLNKYPVSLNANKEDLILMIN